MRGRGVRLRSFGPWSRRCLQFVPADQTVTLRRNYQPHANSWTQAWPQAFLPRGYLRLLASLNTATQAPRQPVGSAFPSHCACLTAVVLAGLTVQELFDLLRCGFFSILQYVRI